MTTFNLRVLAITALISLFCYGNSARLRRLGDLALAMDMIHTQYVDETDDKKLYRSAMNGMLNSLDPYSSYISIDAFKPFQAMLEQEFGGLGVSVDGPPRRERLTIVSTLYDSPAFRAGVKPSDVVLEVDNVPVTGEELSEVTKLLRGRIGTAVTLTLERKGLEEPIKIAITRAKIEVESVLGDRRLPDGRWDFEMQGDPDVGYFHLELFGEKTAAELKAGIQSRSKPWKGIILDLRDNTGGLLHSATEICDMFLEYGEMVSTRGRDLLVDDFYYAKPGVVLPDSVPMVVLVNDQSASASEVLSACLQDRERATVVGTRTFGKGSVQNVIPLEGGKAAMRLTTAYYYPPKGRLIHRRKDAKPDAEWGVKPNDGYELAVDEKGLVSIAERLLHRSDPNFELPKPAADEQDPCAQKDPTLRDDPQLLLALEAIGRLASKQLVDK